MQLLKALAMLACIHNRKSSYIFLPKSFLLPESPDATPNQTWPLRSCEILRVFVNGESSRASSIKPIFLIAPLVTQIRGRVKPAFDAYTAKNSYSIPIQVFHLGCAVLSCLTLGRS